MEGLFREAVVLLACGIDGLRGRLLSLDPELFFIPEDDVPSNLRLQMRSLRTLVTSSQKIDEGGKIINTLRHARNVKLEEIARKILEIHRELE